MVRREPRSPTGIDTADPSPVMLRERFQTVVESVKAASLAEYSDRVLSAALFGSVARGTMHPDSDIDLLLVVADLPNGRMPRVRKFDAVERRLEPLLAAATLDGIHTTVSPVFTTSQELEYGSPLFLDMTDQVLLLHDPAGVMRSYLHKLTGRLCALGCLTSCACPTGCTRSRNSFSTATSTSSPPNSIRRQTPFGQSATRPTPAERPSS